MGGSSKSANNEQSASEFYQQESSQKKLTYINEQGETVTLKPTGDTNVFLDFKRKQAAAAAKGYQVKDSVVGSNLTSDFAGL